LVVEERSEEGNLIDKTNHDIQTVNLLNKPHIIREESWA